MTPHHIDYPPSELAFSVCRRDGYTVAAIGGAVGIVCVPALREQFPGLLGPHANRIIVDLSGVTFCDASAPARPLGAAAAAGRRR
jgi:anti-anti-sigma regulatory factor